MAKIILPAVCKIEYLLHVPGSSRRWLLRRGGRAGSGGWEQGRLSSFKSVYIYPIVLHGSYEWETNLTAGSYEDYMRERYLKYFLVKFAFCVLAFYFWYRPFVLLIQTSSSKTCHCSNHTHVKRDSISVWTCYFLLKMILHQP